MENLSDLDVAIIGMACRFPGANNHGEFWNNLVNGIESIKRLSDEEILKAGVNPDYLKNPSYVKAAPVIDEPGVFDASFFGFTPSEALALDPQHRILLTCGYESLQNAGYDPEKFKGRIGVFTGSAMNTYFMASGLNSKFVDEYIPTLIGNDKDFLSTRISYKLNLKGPSINVQTACSTSLVAIHLACQSLLSRESDMALAGAVSVKVPHNAGYIYDGGGVVSPDGHVRAFDAKANGTVFGSGAGIIVLKRLSDALNDRDNILAIIKGSAVNNDGSEKVGYTAPSIGSQADVVIEAISNSDIDAESISYIEAHGSGTPVGDPIEISALTKAFRAFTDKNNFCAIGSVKTNVGHLDAAAGMAGIIKTILALNHKKIPASLNYYVPNPEIDFPNTPFYVNSRLTDWYSESKRIAGVMSTGMGGTNAHIILQEAPEINESFKSDRPKLILMSAKEETALENFTKEFQNYLAENNLLDLKNIAYTTQMGRKFFKHRKFFVAKNKEQAIETLGSGKSKTIFATETIYNKKRPIIFLLPGIGDHYVGMGYDLYHNFKAFREEIDKCSIIIGQYLDVDIREILYPNDFVRRIADTGGSIDLKQMLAGRVNKSADTNTQKLNQTLYVQPALFIIEYALAKFWMYLGINPVAIAGHSMGEYVAACLAGVFTLEDALKLITRRAKLVNSLPEGSMLAVTLSESELLPLLDSELSISLINAPNLCVVAGESDKVNEFEKILKNKNILYRQVQNAHAFHSRMMDPILNDFINEVRQVKLNSPKIPYTSNLTGEWISDSEATDPGYWAKHTNSTARFSKSLEKIWKLDNPILLEVGPGNTMSVLAMQQSPSNKNTGISTISSLRAGYDNQSDLTYLLTSVGKFWLSGIEIDWEKLYGDEKPRRVSIPTYPFTKVNYWLQNEKIIESKSKSASIHKTSDISDWFYIPSWKRLMTRPVGQDAFAAKIKAKQNWLVFLDNIGISSGLIERLSYANQEIIIINRGDEFKFNGASFTIRPDNYLDYELLINKLKEEKKLPDKIIHCWNISDSQNIKTGNDNFYFQQDMGFYSLLFLSKALAKNKVNKNILLWVISNELHEITGTELFNPEKTPLIGPCLVIPQEYPNINVKNIDIDINDINKQISYLSGELIDSSTDVFVAYHSNQRWVQSYEKINLERIQETGSIFRKNGIYLITGGTGEIGSEIALYLAKTYQSKLILVGRQEIPGNKFRKDWLVSHDSDDRTSSIIKKIQNLESLGSEVLYFTSNVADLNNMQNIITQTIKKFGEINGIFHAAGIVGKKGFFNIKDLDNEKCNEHFQAKIHGVYILEKILEGRNLDFCMLVSSLTPILGGLGEVAYASSNIFMDAFVRRHNRFSDTKWISVNWDLWRIKRKTLEETGFGKTLAELGILPDEGMDVMERVLTLKDVPQIIVSTGDLNARIDQWIKLDSLQPEKLGADGSENDSAFNLQSKLEMNEDISLDEVKIITLKIWKDILGGEKINANDNFFELGGHSLLAIQLISSIRKSFQIDIGLDDIFNASKLSEMVKRIKELISIKVD